MRTLFLLGLGAVLAAPSCSPAPVVVSRVPTGTHREAAAPEKVEPAAPGALVDWSKIDWYTPKPADPVKPTKGCAHCDCGTTGVCTCAADCPCEFGYLKAAERAVAKGLPLVVAVGCEPEDWGAYEVVCVRTLEGYTAPCVVVSKPARGWLDWVKTLPAGATAEDIRESLRPPATRPEANASPAPAAFSPPPQAPPFFGGGGGPMRGGGGRGGSC